MSEETPETKWQDLLKLVVAESLIAEKAIGKSLVDCIKYEGQDAERTRMNCVEFLLDTCKDLSRTVKKQEEFKQTAVIMALAGFAVLQIAQELPDELIIKL